MQNPADIDTTAPSPAAIAAKRQRALDELQQNCGRVMGFDRPVLFEGGVYVGVWLECAPLESLIYGQHVDPVIALNTHDVFFHHQRADGYIPFLVEASRVRTSQIQMVVPIAATALETADLTGDEAFLARAYEACARWDAWLRRHRDTRGTGLCEAFCEFDTGHDNSPRFAGLPKSCPNDDAAVCPAVGKLPYLAPDLSATVYGGRLALARMAERLGKAADAQRWLTEAGQLRERILARCFDPEDECFYDVDRDGAFVKIRSDALSRVLSEHVPDQALFERIYARYIINPAEFWTPYPMPSISIADPAFVRDLPLNSWGGASQALTALRSPRWFDHYGKQADHRQLMRQWVKAILAADGFMQQMNPWTGVFSTSPGYSPCMLVFLEFTRRLGLAGDTERREEKQ